MCPRVHIDGTVRHLDVGSSYPGGGEATKGMAVRHLKRYVSWVQTVGEVKSLKFLVLSFQNFLKTDNLKLRTSVTSP